VKGTERATAAGDPNRLREVDDAKCAARANVCNAVSTREEVVLLFGLNQSCTPDRRTSRFS
jgi:hypothetical protein